jgi:hypothetical protein
MSSNSPIDPIRHPKGRILLVRSAFVCALLITLLVAFYLAERARGQAAWKAYQAEARARGVKLMLAEYVPPPVPDERNFAAVPIFQDAFRQPQPPNPLAFPAAAGVKQPPLDSAGKGQPIDLEAWQKFFVAAKMLPATGESAAVDVLKALERYAPQFEQLRLAGARPECRLPVRYEDGAATALPHLQIVQSAARLYALRLAAHLALGDRGAAYEDFRGALRLHTAMQNEPTLIAGLVRVSVLATVENAVWGGLVRRQWTGPELEKMTADLTEVRLMDDYALGLGSERGFSNLIHEQLLQNGAGELASLLAMSAGVGTAPAGRTTGALLSLYPSGWLRLSQTRANRYCDEMLVRVAQEPPRIFSERPVPSWPQDLSKVGLLERVRYLLFLTMAPALNEVERSYGYAQTLLDQTRLGCALERHRLAHGSFPVTLDELAPTQLPALPRDVMTGAPFRYRVNEDGGYSLYSVAWNLQDDGGKLDTQVAAKQQPDWTWSVPGK